MDAPLRPEREGSKELGPTINDNGTLHKYELSLGQAESLSRLAEEYVFFSPALLYLFGSFHDGLLIDYMSERSENIKVYYKLFDQQIFDGLSVGTDPTWNFALWAVRRDQWQSFCDAVLLVTLAFREKKTLIRYGEQTLTIVDPLAAAKRTQLAMQIVAFGVMNAKVQIAFNQVPGRRPHPASIPALPEIQEETAAYFAGRNQLNARLNAQNRARREARRDRR